MPLLDVELTGDDRGGPVVAIIEDFQEVARGAVVKREYDRLLPPQVAQ
jgi:hypothetical protein